MHCTQIKPSKPTLTLENRPNSSSPYVTVAIKHVACSGTAYRSLQCDFNIRSWCLCPSLPHILVTSTETHAAQDISSVGTHLLPESRLTSEHTV